MVTRSLEQKVNDLEETVATLKHELERTQAVNEIQNLFGRLQFLHSAGLDWDTVPMYSTRPDTRLYRGELGYWEGSDAAKRVRSIGRRSDAERIGNMPVHLLTTPIIEVAKDGKTAKGAWVAAGIVAHKNRETGEPQCGWEWDKYGIDFIKEDGKWKFWHHHIYRLFHGCGWDENWAEQFKKPEMTMAMPDGLKPDGPAVDDNPYRPDTLQKLIPMPPEPYETWNDVTSY